MVVKVPPPRPAKVTIVLGDQREITHCEYETPTIHVYYNRENEPIKIEFSHVLEVDVEYPDTRIPHG